MTHADAPDDAPVINRRPAGLRILGTDTGGRPWGFVERGREAARLRVVRNGAASPLRVAQAVETGSRLGFTQSLGVSVSTGALLFVERDGAPPAALPYADAFGAIRTRLLSLAVPQRGAVAVWELRLSVAYFRLSPIMGPAGRGRMAPEAWVWLPGGEDVIHTGRLWTRIMALAAPAPERVSA